MQEDWIQGQPGLYSKTEWQNQVWVQHGSLHFQNSGGRASRIFMSLSYPGLHSKFQENQWYISSPCLKELRKKKSDLETTCRCHDLPACFRHFVANGTSWNLLRLCARLQITMCPWPTEYMESWQCQMTLSERFLSDFLEAVAKTAFLFLVLWRNWNGIPNCLSGARIMPPSG